MKDLLAEIQKVVPPGGTPRRMLYQGASGSPTGTLYEVVGEVLLVQDPPTVAGPSQQEGGTRPSSSGRATSGTRCAGIRRKSTGSVRTGRDQSPVRRTLDRSRTPIRNPEPTAFSSRRKGTPTRALSTSPADGLMTCPALQPPSRAASSRNPRTTPSSRRQDPVQHLGDEFSPLRSVRKGSTVFGTPHSSIPRAEGAGNLEEEIVPPPNMRRMLTRLQRVSEAGGSSTTNNLGSHTKEGAAQKQHRSSKLAC